MDHRRTAHGAELRLRFSCRPAARGAVGMFPKLAGTGLVGRAGQMGMGALGHRRGSSLYILMRW